MDPATVKMLFQLGTYGPLGIMVILFVVLFVRQLKENKELRDANDTAQAELQDKLLELSKASIKADIEHTETLRSMTKVLDSIDRRLS